MPRDEAAVLRPFGWRGIELAVPRTWELNAYDGDASTGHVMLDDGIAIRLQIHWHSLRKAVGDLAATLEQYQRKLIRTTRQALQFEVLGREFLPKRVHTELDALPYAWEGQQKVFGIAARCLKCNRALFVELFFPVDQVDKRLARQILASLTDHRQDDQAGWCVYGLAFKTPRAYTLVRPILMPGKLQFTFRKPQNSSWLHPGSWFRSEAKVRTESKIRTESWIRLERWTTATEVLEQLPLERWPMEMLKAAQIRTNSEVILSENTVGGRPAFSFDTTARQGVGRSSSLWGTVWRDTEVRKVVGVFGSATEPGVLQQVADSVVCY